MSKRSGDGLVRRVWGLGAAGAVAAALLAGGCQSNNNPNPEPESPPAQAYTGPDYLRGTVGSMASLRNYEPMLVEGYGLVVGLDGTGSAEVPSFLRQRLINRARQMGFGSRRLIDAMPEQYQAAASMSPQRLLADDSTAVVAVQGLMPPGARTGARFDLLVSAVDTQTTSLAGGMLLTTDLGIGGTNPAYQFVRPRAEGRGPIYIDPIDDEQEAEARREHMLQAIVVGGGEVTESRHVELVLNQPSFTRSARIADRINERFPAEPGERRQTAEAQTDRFIRLNVPRRYADNPTELINKIAHLYIQGGGDFVTEQARRLGQVLEAEPDDEAASVVLAWQALGPRVEPVVREYYEHEDLSVRLAALEAGARLEDERATEHLSELAMHEDEQVRRRVAQSLARLPDSLRGARALRELLSAPEREVRIAAYRAMAAAGDPHIDRFAVRNRQGVKFLVERVASERPMIYITQDELPRIVIFQGDLGFEEDVFARVWDNRLMVRGREEENGMPAHLEVFFQRPWERQGQRYRIQPTVATLAYLLAHEPTADEPQEGFNLTYGEVVDALYRLSRAGAIPAPVEIERGALAERVAEFEGRESGRPEFAAADAEGLSAEEVAPAEEPPSFEQSQAGAPTPGAETPAGVGAAAQPTQPAEPAEVGAAEPPIGGGAAERQPTAEPASPEAGPAAQPQTPPQQEGPIDTGINQPQFETPDNVGAPEFDYAPADEGDDLDMPGLAPQTY